MKIRSGPLNFALRVVRQQDLHSMLRLKGNAVDYCSDWILFSLKREFHQSICPSIYLLQVIYSFKLKALIASPLMKHDFLLMSVVDFAPTVNKITNL